MIQRRKDKEKDEKRELDRRGTERKDGEKRREGTERRELWDNRERVILEREEGQRGEVKRQLREKEEKRRV